MKDIIIYDEVFGVPYDLEENGSKSSFALALGSRIIENVMLLDIAKEKNEKDNKRNTR